MGFFDFLTEIPPYADKPNGALRLNRRRELLVQPYRAQLQGARVLDLAAHDGRWCFALAEAGAAEVVGIEARPDLVDRFARFPDHPHKHRIDLRQGDIYEALERMVATGERFDVVAVYGVFYHIIEHFRLLRLIRALRPKLVLIDSEFSLRKPAVIDMLMEDTSKHLNAAPQVAGQERAIIGIPSHKALNFMAQALGFETSWADPAEVFGENRVGVQDYFRPEVKRRGFCALAPVQAG